MSNFTVWLKNNHPEYMNEIFGLAKKIRGPKSLPMAPVTAINTADFDLSFKDAKGDLYMPHHDHYYLARNIYTKQRKRLK